jgi:peptide/nickel transport system substrate-binding protein
VRRPLLALAAIVLMLASACGGGGARTSSTVADGTVVLRADQEPAIINPWNPFTVTYRLKDEAEWSDGVPITARDIQFTLEVCRNPDFNIAVREGCDKVDMAASEIVDDKTFRMVFTEPYAPWQSLFSAGYGAILPAHELEGKNFNDVWDFEITVSSGPYEFGGWNRGQSMTLVRNDDFWGEPTPSIEQIVVRFVEDSTSQVQALLGGEVDVLASQAQIELVEQVEAIQGVTSEAAAGAVWEFFEYNFATDGLGMAGRGEEYAFVRQAIAMGIDRAALVTAADRPDAPGRGAAAEPHLREQPAAVRAGVRPVAIRPGGGAAPAGRARLRPGT